MVRRDAAHKLAGEFRLDYVNLQQRDDMETGIGVKKLLKDDNIIINYENKSRTGREKAG